MSDTEKELEEYAEQYLKEVEDISKWMNGKDGDLFKKFIKKFNNRYCAVTIEEFLIRIVIDRMKQQTNCEDHIIDFIEMILGDMLDNSNNEKEQQTLH